MMIKNFLRSVSEYWKGLTAVVSIVTTISIVSVKIDRKHFRESVREAEKIEIREDINCLSNKVDTLYTHITDINLTLNNITEGMKIERKNRELLQESYIEYVRKNTKNTEELYNALKNFINDQCNNEMVWYE